MIVLRILKSFFLGAVAQLVIGFALIMFRSDLASYTYWPWILAGDGLFPSGPGGHAMPGGAIIGFLIGFLIYSIIIGFGIDYLIKWGTAKNKV